MANSVSKWCKEQRKGEQRKRVVVMHSGEGTKEKSKAECMHVVFMGLQITLFLI